MKKTIFLIFIIIHFLTNAQVCDSVVPTFYINFSGSSAGTTWTSPDTVGMGYCCSASGFDRCINFIVTTDSSTSALFFSFQIPAGPPIGSLNYQVDCGSTLIADVDTQKISTCGTHCITCCKPGNKRLIYQVASIKNTNATSCGSYSQCNNITSNTELKINPPQVSFFPNPFYASTTLHTNLNKFKLCIYNTFGVLVFKDIIDWPTTIIDRNDLSGGIYLYQITTDTGQIYNGKIVIE